jgi:hypothetical protein
MTETSLNSEKQLRELWDCFHLKKDIASMTTPEFHDWINKQLLNSFEEGKQHERAASRPHYLREIGYMLYGGILATVGFVLAVIL